MSKPKPEKFRFKKLDSVGAAAAEDDREFLQECFVNTGDLTALRDCNKPYRVILGRTGAGKSAILLKLAELEPRCIQIRPESLALAHISNSTILNYLSELGVKLDVFFKLLWRHVFTVEILKQHFGTNRDTGNASFLSALYNSIFGNKKHEKAIAYLKEWGETFWEETEYRIKELTSKLETDIKADIGTKIPMFTTSIGGSSKICEDEKVEVVQRAQAIVNKVQIRELSDIIALLDDILSDHQKPYYIIIDRLDENWIEDQLRLRLIRALIETVKDFNRVRNAKIIIAIRVDLIDRVFRLTRDSGFQEEKYESLFLPLSWNRQQMIDILDARINTLIRRQYTKQVVTHKDILPKEMDGDLAIDYLLERTMMRPRDLIMFFNLCLEKAVGHPTISQHTIREAEGEYSRNRLRSLADEWISDYPNLLEFIDLVKGKKRIFLCSEITESDCSDACLNLIASNRHNTSDELFTMANRVVNDNESPTELRRVFLEIGYRVGLVGLKFENYESVAWSSRGRSLSPGSKITTQTRVAIHPTFFRVLGTKFN